MFFFTPDGLVIFLAALVAGALIGWGLARWGHTGLAWALVALAMLVALGVTFNGYNQPGLRGLWSAMTGVVVIAPLGVAGALGILIETLRQRRAALRTLRNREGGPG